ncbi:MAG: hypothetical protein WHV66_09395 [Anaerolineales bacterium]|jgi:hypothetical protein
MNHLNHEYTATETKTIRPPKILKLVGPTFWTFASLVSLTANLILVIVVILLGSQLFALKRTFRDELIGKLYHNFALMDRASIKTTIPVSATVPARFDLPLETDTTVVLISDTTIRGAKVSLATGGLSIFSAPTDIVLPAGTQLPIHLSLVVPVDQLIPVSLEVPVDIPLNQTELHEPFIGLQETIAPYYQMIDRIPGSWAEVFCGTSPGVFCKSIFSSE